MTREEAIKILKTIRVYDCYPKSAGAETKEAIEMAIKSLEQEPVFDKIRAEIDGIEINGQIDEHTMFIRSGEQVKQMALDVIDKYK